MRKNDIENLRKKLERLKQAIDEKLKETSKNINSLNSLNQSEEAELGSVMSLAKVDENIFSVNHKELDEIKKALAKIKQNKYGKCEMCGEEINIERLYVKPFARFCIQCRELFEAQNKINKRTMQ